MGAIIVTGANRGIGLELCKQLKEKGAEVIGVCRRASEALSGLGVRVEEGVDVTDDVSVAALAQRLEGVAVDTLINNAGVLRVDSLDNLNFDDLRFQFEVNSIGPLRVTKALLPNLAKGSKVAIVSSRMGSIDDNGSGRMYGYRMSKAAVNMGGTSLAKDLQPQGIPVAILHPGMVATEMTGGRGISPEEAARGLLTRIDGLTLENSGTFWHANGEVLPW